MNFIYLKGIIQNIQHSHTIGNTNYNKAELIVKRKDGREDILIVKFKEFSFDAQESKEVELIGHIRSFSQQKDGKNKVDIYVFSYFDLVEEDYGEYTNIAKLEGKICKKDTLRTSQKGKHYIHFIIANNLILDDNQRLNSYIPCVAWGQTAKDIDSNYSVNDTIHIDGELHSREYKKKLDEETIELRIAHEFAISNIEKI
jgi:hypothetical protein